MPAPESTSPPTAPHDAAAAATGTPDHQAAPSRAIEITFAVVTVAFCATYLALGTQIDLRRDAAPGQIDARFWPTVLGSTGVGLSVVLLVTSITRPVMAREGVERLERGGLLRVLGTCALTLGYIGLWSYASVSLFGFRYELFPIATALLLAALLWLYGHRGWVGLIVYPVATTAFIYVLFGIVLRIPL